MDNDTQKVLSEAETIISYVDSKGWQIVKEKFQQKIMDLQSIKNLEAKSSTGLASEIKVRNTVVDVLLEIIKEVEAKAEQHKGNIPLMGDNIIEKFD